MRRPQLDCRGPACQCRWTTSSESVQESVRHRFPECPRRSSSLVVFASPQVTARFRSGPLLGDGGSGLRQMGGVVVGPVVNTQEARRGQTGAEVQHPRGTWAEADPEIVAIALGTGAFFFIYVLFGVRVVEKDTLRNASSAPQSLARSSGWHSSSLRPSSTGTARGRRRGLRRGGRRATKASLAGAE